MELQLELDILPQPDDETCGATCLHSVYRYYGDHVPLDRVIDEVPRLESGGTLAMILGRHALKRGYRALIYTYNLQMFDPSWFTPNARLRDKLEQQARYKQGKRLRKASEYYLEFLDMGGEIRFEDLTSNLLRKYLNQSVPVLTGLSGTYLYRCPRELGTEYDDVRGTPQGHFVVLCGYHAKERKVLIADPFLANPVSNSHTYEVSIDRLICSILLGVLTYDAKLLIIRPKE